MDGQKKTGTEVIREIMVRQGITQEKMAVMMGYTHASSVNGRLQTGRISAEKLNEFLEVLGYELVIRKVCTEPGDEPEEWVITK